MDDSSVRLSQLRSGQKARIVRIEGNGPFRHRLIEMGFIPGAEIFVERFAPLMDPGEFVIKGYRVSLRRSEAAKIIVGQVVDAGVRRRRRFRFRGGWR